MGVFRSVALAGGLTCAALWLNHPVGAEERSSLPPTPVTKYLKGVRNKMNELVHLKGGNCVDPGSNGFVCWFNANGQALLVKASTLGPDTSLEIAEALLEQCKGTANLSSSKCRFDIEITATNTGREMLNTGGGSRQMVVVYTNMVDMYSPR